MLPQKFFDVLKHEGVVSLTTWGRDVPPCHKHMEFLPRYHR